MPLPIPQPSAEELENVLDQIKSLVVNKYANTSPPSDFVVPSAETLTAHSQRLIQQLPETGLGFEPSIRFCQRYRFACTQQPIYWNLSWICYWRCARPPALVGDYIVSLFDQNVHRYGDSFSCQLSRMWRFRLFLNSFTLTQAPGRADLWPAGATASNILALAVGREHVLAQHIAANEGPDASGSTPLTSEIGLFKAMKLANLESMQVLHCLSHSSIAKACAVLGLGRTPLCLSPTPANPGALTLPNLKSVLLRPMWGPLLLLVLARSTLAVIQEISPKSERCATSTMRGCTLMAPLVSIHRRLEAVTRVNTRPKP